MSHIVQVAHKLLAALSLFPIESCPLDFGCQPKEIEIREPRRLRTLEAFECRLTGLGGLRM